MTVQHRLTAASPPYARIPIDPQRVTTALCPGSRHAVVRRCAALHDVA